MLIFGLVAGCASAADPPGGPPDEVAPVIARFEPESGAVLTTPPREANIWFDEVINERVLGTPPDIHAAVLLSPVAGEVRVSWHRDHLSVRPRNGFVAGRVYRIEVLPVLTDLRTNRLRAGRTIIFSTGPAIPDAMLQGALVDWVAARPGIRTLVEAILLPDSLSYRVLTDSSGYFQIAQLPPGRYLVRGVMDTNNDRRLGAREAYDSVTIDVDSSAEVELFAFTHDTTGPRLRQVEETDSLTLKLTFDRPLDPGLRIDTADVTVATLEDSTVRLPVVTGVYTPQSLEAAQKREADSIAAARAAADSIAAANDTTRRAAPDSARAPARQPAAPARPPAAVIPLPGPRSPVPAPRGAVRPADRAPLDSSRAERMLARRPAPSDVVLLRLVTPLARDTRHVIYANRVRSLSGNESAARATLRTPRPRPAAPGPRTTPTDSATAPLDSVTAPSDSARPAPARPTRPDTTRPDAMSFVRPARPARLAP